MFSSCSYFLLPKVKSIKGFLLKISKFDSCTSVRHRKCLLSRTLQKGRVQCGSVYMETTEDLIINVVQYNSIQLEQNIVIAETIYQKPVFCCKLSIGSKQAVITTNSK
jgi:hypothetical protein